MKKPKAKAKADELRPEYDLRKRKGAVQGKFATEYKAGHNLALLAPDVRAAFPTDKAVNTALRSLIKGRAPANVITGQNYLQK